MLCIIIVLWNVIVLLPSGRGNFAVDRHRARRLRGQVPVHTYGEVMMCIVLCEKQAASP